MAYRRIARLAGFVVLALSGALVTASPVFAATISVTTPLDENGGPGDPVGLGCSLREALKSANTLTANGGCSAGTGNDTIDVPAGTYNVLAGELAIGGPNLVATIQGAGSATTIIQTLGAPCAGPSRIFNVDVGGATVSNVTFSGLTIRNGTAVTGGGGIRISGPASTVTVADSVLSGNCASGGSNGGAIDWAFGTAGTLTIDNSTFTGNTAAGPGGAISVAGQGNAVTVLNSTFATNNAVQDGGAVSLGGTFVLSHIDGSIFTSNSTLIGHGAAVAFAAGQLLAGTTAANVFVGNLAPSNPTTKSIYGGPFAFGVVPNNWYGCNEGPTNPACDGASNAIGGGLVFSPWIILSNSASPSSIPLNGTSTLTADFLHNSGGASLPATQVAALAGRTVTWNNAVNGSLSAQQTTIQSNGTATAVFTPAALGSGSADATVDNATATAVITVDKGNPTIAITSDSPDPSVVGQIVTVQYSVTPTTPTAPTGNVTVSDGVDSCTATVAVGQCTLTLTTVGSRSLTATYAGDANFNGSTSAPAAHTVNAIPDTTSPTVSNVNTILREGGHIGSVSVTVSWSAADDATPTNSLVFQIQRRRFRMHGPTAWQDVATVTGQTSLHQVPLWHRYQYRVRAMDQAGNWSGYTEALPITFIRRDQGAFTRDASWTITPVAGAMRGSVARSSTPGGMASLTFTGNGVAVVATTGPGQGTLQACIDPGTASQSCRTIDLSTLPAGLKQLPVVFTMPWATHTLQVTVIAGTVDLDGAIFSR